MSTAWQDELGSQTPPTSQEIDDVCDRFEAALKAALQGAVWPGIEQYLEQVVQSERSLLVRELILLEVDYKSRVGQSVSPDDYLARFPTLSLRWWQRKVQRSETAGLPQIQGYELLEEIGRGNMGIVYKARHLKLKRIVALKMIRDGKWADPLEVARFRTEAEAAARLTCPNIVQVYDVGEAGGLPYCALEFVAQESLAQRLRGTPVPAKDTARWLTTMASAVQVAHKAGVLHRDIKPGNILFAADGTLKLTDFGLAKLLDEVGQTRSREILGTPSYMAPEQATGQRDKIGPATDVYALGAVLYECLTGRPPFRAATIPATLKQVENDDPVRPSRLNPQTPRDLQTICLKCLSKRPEKRYPSAAALAEDLERFQAGLPIHARPPGSLQLVVQWARRRPTTAAFLTVAVLALAGLLGSGGYFTAVLEEHNRQLIQEQQKTEAALGRSQVAEKSASEQRQLALKTLRRVVNQIHARLKDQPKQQELRKALLGEALAGLKEVASAADTSQADHETIWVLFELGFIYRDIEVGGLPEAERQFEHAYLLARQLVERDPKSVQARRDVAVALKYLGEVHWRRGDNNAAIKLCQDALNIHRELAEESPEDLKAQGDLSAALDRLGNLKRQQGDNKGALECFQEALTIHRKRVHADPKNPKSQRDLGMALIHVGHMEFAAQNWQAALEYYEQAGEIFHELEKAAPQSARAQGDLAFFWDNKGNIQRAQGKIAAALESYQTSLGFDCKRLEGDPDNWEIQQNMAVSLSKVGAIHLQMGDVEAAAKSFQGALEIRRKLSKASLDDALAEHDLAVSLAMMGDVQSRRGKPADAREFYSQANAIFTKQAAANPTNFQAQRDLFVVLVKFAGLAVQSSEFRQAVELYVKALEIAKAFPNPANFHKDVAMFETHLGALLDKQPAAERLTLLPIVHQSFVKHKEYTKAIQTATLLADLAVKPGDVYDAACAFALCVPLAEPGEAQEKLAKQAIDLLEKAVVDGFKNVARLKGDVSLDSLRCRDHFKELLTRLEQELDREMKSFRRSR
jgi:tetratricopeptide (TPR) repeat protein/tRNA A-37 threonylcarbamoyl transferase component Bud32